MKSDKRKSGSAWLCLLLILLALSALLCAWLLFRGGEGTIASIYVDGVCERKIDLSAVVEPYQFVLQTEDGENTVSVENGRISISHADCPDGVCVKTGWIDNTAKPIVCLPHKVVIRIEAMPTGSDSAPDIIVN